MQSQYFAIIRNYIVISLAVVSVYTTQQLTVGQTTKKVHSGMTTGWRSRYWKLRLVSALAISDMASCADCTKAQIAPDTTLRVENSIVTPNVIINEIPSEQIETKRLTVRNRAVVSTGTFGSGNAGKLTVRASEVELIGTSADGSLSSGLFPKTRGDGDARDLTIETGKLNVRDGAEVTVSSEGLGMQVIQKTRLALSIWTTKHYSVLERQQGRVIYSWTLRLCYYIAAIISPPTPLVQLLTVTSLLSLES